jgi:hypothetical protein
MIIITTITSIAGTATIIVIAASGGEACEPSVVLDRRSQRAQPGYFQKRP